MTADYTRSLVRSREREFVFQGGIAKVSRSAFSAAGTLHEQVRRCFANPRCSTFPGAPGGNEVNHRIMDAPGCDGYNSGMTERMCPMCGAMIPTTGTLGSLAFGFVDWRFFVVAPLFVLAALAYYLALRWVDQNSSWS